MNKGQLNLMSFMLFLVASFSTSCVNYGAFQGITSDGLYIGPLPIQSRVVEPQIFSLTDTSSIWHDNYFSYVGQIHICGRSYYGVKLKIWH